MIPYAEYSKAFMCQMKRKTYWTAGVKSFWQCIDFGQRNLILYLLLLINQKFALDCFWQQRLIGKKPNQNNYRKGNVLKMYRSFFLINCAHYVQENRLAKKWNRENIKSRLQRGTGQIIERQMNDRRKKGQLCDTAPGKFYKNFIVYKVLWTLNIVTNEDHLENLPVFFSEAVPSFLLKIFASILFRSFAKRPKFIFAISVFFAPQLSSHNGFLTTSYLARSILVKDNAKKF